MSGPFIRFTFADGSTADLPLAKVRDDVRDQLKAIALDGDPEPLEAFREAEARDVAQAQVAAAGRSRGGKARAARAQAVPQWMGEVFAQAYADLEADCRASIGPDMLLKQAWKVAGRGHLKLAKLTDYRAREYLKTRPK